MHGALDVCDAVDLIVIAEQMFVMGGFNFLRGRYVRDAWDLISFAGELFTMREI